MFDKISNSLKAALSLSGIQSVYDYEASNFEGYPALTLTPANNESAYSTTTENRRVYAFTARIYVQRGSDAATLAESENTMRELVDSVLDAIDKRYSSLSIASQTGYTFLFMHAAPSQWGYAGGANELRVAEVLIKVEFDIDVNLIS